MPQSATPSLRLPVGPLPLDVDFLGGRLTSDGGLPWLAAADADLGQTASLAAEIPDWRTRRGRHPLPDLERFSEDMTITPRSLRPGRTPRSRGA